ncbi:MAG: hypothetical protein HMLKMBBP_01234 [Planctomycetes bacterium]|nr:hypothetical protein [Planctomycetota bacterium]
MTDPATLRRTLDAVIANVERAVFGKREQVKLAIVGLVAEGHVLLEDVPGTGKTTLARALARSLALEFRRVQFTSDLLPADLLGISVLDPATHAFAFHPGPVFTNVLLADELNRSTPRTQSALLECMAERRVSVEGRPHELPHPFFVIATQNPLEFEGTYPLPESQLDRFMLRIEMGYPAPDDERRLLRARPSSTDVDALPAVATAADLASLVAAARAVRVDPSIEDYVLALLDGSRRSRRFHLGLSPRAGVALTRAAQASAIVEGRDFVLPDDVKRLSVPVLAHRVVGAATAAGDGADGVELVEELVSRTAVPA